MSGTPDLQEHVRRAKEAGKLVVQPRMGFAAPEEMALGLRAVARARATTIGTITLDSYTRVGDHVGARRALGAGHPLNGYPIVAHGAHLTEAVAAYAVDDRTPGAEPIPVQVRHGSANPRAIFRTAIMAGLTASEGGPVSYCLPYGRTPLAESVRNWDAAVVELADGAGERGARAHLETFGGCMLGQLCPPSLLIALSVLEGLFFAQRGIPTVSLSYAQQTNPVQDVEALAALRLLAGEVLPSHVDWHVVLYTYMGVFPRTAGGAGRLLDASAELAVRGGAERLIVKTAVEADRIPTVPENIAALERAARVADLATRTVSAVPWAADADCSELLDEARALVAAVADGGDVGKALVRAFAAGVLDVPFCLHRDNLGLTRTRIDDDGRLRWAHTGRLPLPAPARSDGRIGAHRLLSMLRFTADGHDRAALRERTPRALPADRPYRVAVVGSGPRGLAVLERLAARLIADPPDGPVEIHLYDPVEVGCGRIWRTDQPPWFLMNTVAGEVTMFSGPPDGGPARPGAGPSLAQWWQETDPACPGPNGYAPRPLYGRYLRFLLDTVERSLPPRVTLVRRRTEVVDLVPDQGGYLLRAADGESLRADRVVLVTGHPRPSLDSAQQRLADFAADRPELLYIRGDSASDMPLDRVPAGAKVGVLGLGLSFYDVMVALTIGRGGRFEEDGGALRYLPSGAEPVIVAGSRSGVPIPARGRNQKPSRYAYRPRVFTADRVRALRRAGRIDFRAEVLPLLTAEMELVYYATEIRGRFGEDVAERFAAEAAADPASIESLAAHFGVADLPRLDLDALSRPFAGRGFAGREEFTAALLDLIDDDLRHAEQGNVDGPVKAACDVLRDTRGVLRLAVDYAGLTPGSHRGDFLSWFTPLASFLAAGPPLLRLRQTRALIESGVLVVVGPSVTFDADPASGRFTAVSPQVEGARIELDAMIDARIPAPHLDRDLAPLPSRLREAGLWTGYVNTHGDERFETGGVAVTGAPFHPVRRDGRPETGLHVLGIPTEHTRWFTQVGSGRPGSWGEFVRDADAIAAGLMSGLPATDRADRADKAERAGELL
ncbi:FAD/NAD(P)-binding protein [Microbispora sp. RL4-1S]|uniref:FAD/NAD(P)-binding protein n=1 Tax=Microbispora oryzae TaxID=2806554 RepID=A0A940WMD2_9ACTN|nr:FAD/NAD(P)-binding protein [Microbispora oryzae]MBP2703224.1 FAD/NAD(P)-binding protein [Microbispora oryzae]